MIKCIKESLKHLELKRKNKTKPTSQISNTSHVDNNYYVITTNVVTDFSRHNNLAPYYVHT